MKTRKHQENIVSLSGNRQKASLGREDIRTNEVPPEYAADTLVQAG